MKTIEYMAPAKLLDDETATIREAADTLLFSDDAELARETLAQVTRLASGLVESGRWIDETADALVRDLEDCGPAATVA
jgi:hypothetical protein